MEISKYFSSGYFIFLFLLLTLGMLSILYLLRIFIPHVFPGKININRFRKYFTIAEGLVWVLYLLAAAFFFLKNNIIFSAVLFLFFLLLLYWYSRFVLRDYIAGLVFKAENRFSLDEIIEIEGQKGKIKKFHYRNIEIENENGKMVLIPNSLLLGVISSPQNISETVLNFSFEIYISSEQPFDIISDQLRKFIFSLPWSVLKNEPKIQFIKEIDDRYIVKITLFSFDEAYFQPMRKRVEAFVKQNYQTFEE
jgi:small-conductance mechanosensitive channel